MMKSNTYSSTEGSSPGRFHTHIERGALMHTIINCALMRTNRIQFFLTAKDTQSNRQPLFALAAAMPVVPVRVVKSPTAAKAYTNLKDTNKKVIHAHSMNVSSASQSFE